jgi:hypothetical protein
LAAKLVTTYSLSCCLSTTPRPDPPKPPDRLSSTDEYGVLAALRPARSRCAGCVRHPAARPIQPIPR